MSTCPVHIICNKLNSLFAIYSGLFVPLNSYLSQRRSSQRLSICTNGDLGEIKLKNVKLNQNWEPDSNENCVYKFM